MPSWTGRHPDRFIVGLGGAHGPNPLRKLVGYLDSLDAVPQTVPVAARIFAGAGTPHAPPGP